MKLNNGIVVASEFSFGGQADFNETDRMPNGATSTTSGGYMVQDSVLQYSGSFQACPDSTFCTPPMPVNSKTKLRWESQNNVWIGDFQCVRDFSSGLFSGGSSNYGSSPYGGGRTAMQIQHEIQENEKAIQRCENLRNNSTSAAVTYGCGNIISRARQRLMDLRAELARAQQ